MTLVDARHPVKVTVTNGSLWVSCETRGDMDQWPLSRWDEALTWAQDHARSGDHEGRFCICCEDYVQTCWDRCMDCGHNT